MIITGRRIIKVPEQLLKKEKSIVAVEATAATMKKLGIEKFEENISVVPNINIGINCKRNVLGYYTVDKSSPKENRYINTIYWTWQLYNGDWQDGYFDVYKDCYPKQYHEPFCVELILRTANDKKIIMAQTNKENIKNTINVFLEVFGYCEVLDNEFNSISHKAEYKRVNWKILPPDIKIEVTRKIEQEKNNKERKRKDYNQERINYMESKKPTERYEGTDGFQGYYAYIFKKYCILESPRYGNASYVVERNNWRELSKLTKKQLINSGKLIKRIEHKALWFEDIKTYLV